MPLPPGSKDRQWDDDKTLLDILPRLHRHHRPLLLPYAESAIQFLATSLRSERSGQVTKTLDVVLQLVGEEGGRAPPAAAVPELLAGLLHVMVTCGKGWQEITLRCLHILLTRCPLPCVHFYAGAQLADSKSSHQKQLTACMLHQGIARLEGLPPTLCPDCRSCAGRVGQPTGSESKGVAALSAPDLAGLLRALAVYAGDGQAATRHHSKESVKIVFARIPGPALTAALRLVGWEEAERLKAIAAEMGKAAPLPTPAKAGAVHRSLPSPLPAGFPVNPSPTHYATLPALYSASTLPPVPAVVHSEAGEEVESWMTGEGLISPFTSPQAGGGEEGVAGGEEEEDAMVVRVHTRQVTPIKLSFGGLNDSTASSTSPPSPLPHDPQPPLEPLPSLMPSPTDLPPHASALEADAEVVGINALSATARPSMKRKRSLSPVTDEEVKRLSLPPALPAVAEVLSSTVGVEAAVEAGLTLEGEVEAALVEWKARGPPASKWVEWGEAALRQHACNEAEESRWRGRAH